MLLLFIGAAEPAIQIKREPRFNYDDYRPNNPVRDMPHYDKGRLRNRPKRFYGTTDLRMPELLDDTGAAYGPSTKDLIRQEIAAQVNEDAETDTASEGQPDESDFVVDVFAPGVEVVGTKKVMFCSGCTDNLTAGFYMAVFSNSMRNQSLVSLVTKKQKKQ